MPMPRYSRYLQFVSDANGAATIESFDDQFALDVDGPDVVRAHIMPSYVVEENGHLVLTDDGKAALAARI